jgi:hypothetical protein
MQSSNCTSSAWPMIARSAAPIAKPEPCCAWLRNVWRVKQTPQAKHNRQGQWGEALLSRAVAVGRQVAADADPGWMGRSLAG